MIKVTGIESLKKDLERISNPALFFDDITRKISNDAKNEFVEETPSDLNITKNLWSHPVQIGLSHYLIENRASTPDGRYAIIDLINDGRKEVRPVKAKMLFIPISKRAKFTCRQFSSAMGAALNAQMEGKDWKFGEDFVFAKKSKAVAPTHMVDKIEEKYSLKLLEAVIKKLDEVFI